MSTLIARAATMPQLRYGGAVFLLMLAGIGLRIYLVAMVQPPGQSIYSDMENYVRMSAAIHAGDWQPEHFFQPIGFPLLLARLRALTPNWLELLGWLQIAASSLTMILVWLAATRSLGRTAGLVVLAIAAIHLPWISFAGFALAETLFTLLLAVLALVTVQLCRSLKVIDALTWGAVFFTALLFKGTHAFIGVLFLPALLLWKGMRALKAAAAISIIVGAGLLAHGFYTQQTIGTFQMTASTGGLNLVEGKCPVKSNVDSRGAAWLSPLYYQLGKTEQKTWDRPFTESAYYLRAGLQCIVDNPLVLLQSFEAIPFLFVGNWLWPSNNLPYQDVIKIYEMLFAIFAIGGLAGFAVLGLRRGVGADVLLTWVVPIAGLFLCVYVFKSEIRYRVPFDVWIIPLATAGWLQLWRARRFLPAGAKPPAPGARGSA